MLIKIAATVWMTLNKFILYIKACKINLNSSLNETNKTSGKKNPVLISVYSKIDIFVC